MVNGFTPIELDGKTYKLCLNFDAMCLWESLTGKGAFTEMPQSLGTLTGGKLILFVMLQKLQGPAFPELKSVNALYQDAHGDLKMSNVKAINDALALELARSWGLGEENQASAKKKESVSPLD